MSDWFDMSKLTFASQEYVNSLKTEEYYQYKQSVLDGEAPENDKYHYGLDICKNDDKIHYIFLATDRDSTVLLEHSVAEVK